MATCKCRRRRFAKNFLFSLFLLSTSWMFFTAYTLMKIYSDAHVVSGNIGARFVKNSNHDDPSNSGPNVIQVVTGFFHDSRFENETAANLTDAELNANLYAPVADAGNMGRAFSLEDPFDRMKARKYFKINQFNILISDRIPLNRSLPDVRKQACKDFQYPSKMPTTSVVIVFHNEAWSTLMRTVTSVVNRSPVHLLEEIILIDDASTRSFLKHEIKNDVARMKVKVHIRRSNERIGLIRARLLGAEIATGDSLTFLDSHCEVTPGWLEPLLYRVQQAPKAFVCPVIDVINDQSFAYQRGIESFRGGFNWGLLFRWYSVPSAWRSRSPLDPVKTPVMAGGLFTVRRKTFYEMGSYDEGMDVWGGENLEMSFRVWQCGGSVEILPCSHVGHIFRHASPHDMPGKQKAGDILSKNLVRMAEIWMDDWKSMYYRLTPKALEIRSKVDVSHRKKLREDLKCENFSWFLQNVFPDHFLPVPGQFFGRVKSKQRNLCLEVAYVMTSSSLGKPVKRASLNNCTSKFDQQQLWILSKDGYLMTNEHQCLTVLKVAQSWLVQLSECSQNPKDKWQYTESSNLILHIQSNLYLGVPSVMKATGETNPPVLSKYQYFDSSSIRWSLVDVEWLNVQ